MQKYLFRVLLKALEEYLALIDAIPPDNVVAPSVLDRLLSALNALAPPRKSTILGSLPYKTLGYPAKEPPTSPSITLEEKAGLLVMESAAVPRLGIPAYHWWNECIHGVGRAGRATQFPVSIALAASWDTELVKRVASAVGDEMRAKHKQGADSGQYQGLTCWGPTINMARDPRWGRTEETYGEDPLLTGQMATAFVTGLQGDDPKYIKVAASPKHLAVYNEEVNREGKNARISEKALREYYLPAFSESIQKGKTSSIMTSYNSVNGVPASVNRHLISDILRKELKFEGVVVPDVSAPSYVRDRHKMGGSYPAVAASFIKAGGSLLADSNEWRGHLLDAVKKHLLSEEDLERPLEETLTVRFRLGEFDPPEKVPYSRVSKEVIGSAEHQRLALQAAREGIVLLQNRPANGDGTEKLLPLDKTRVRSIAVIGPFADNIYLGGYSGLPTNPPVTAFAGIVKKASSSTRVTLVPWRPQEKYTRGQMTLRAEDQAAIRESDVVIAVMGLGEQYEREGIDRKDLRLPPEQSEYLKRAYTLNKRLVLVLHNGGPISDVWIRDNIPAVIDSWYPGERGGEALAEVLFGDENPAGRLPVTVYFSEKQLLPMDDYEVTHGRTYRYLKQKPLYPFGHGESYTTFRYGGLKIWTSGQGDKQEIKVGLEVMNTGKRSGDEVVQVYGTKLNPRHGQPKLQLLAFRRIHLKAGESLNVAFSIPAQELRYWNEELKHFSVEGGAYEIRVGASSEDIRLRETVEVAER